MVGSEQNLKGNIMEAVELWHRAMKTKDASIWEELLDEESALWKAKVATLAEYAKAYVHKYVAVEEEEASGETKPAAR